MRRILALTFLTALALSMGLVAGCSDSDSTSNLASGGKGQIQIHLVDAPGDFDQVNVEVIEVRVHRGDEDTLSGWHSIAVDTTLVNLLDLTDGNYAVLADSTLPSGHYTQIRLILGENNTVMVDSVLHDLTVPSGSQSGLKLNHPFDITDGMSYAVTLDFDAHRSVHQTGNGVYKLRPVIRLVVDEFAGGIVGVIEPVDARAMILTTAGEDTVVAYADTLTGAFAFHMLPVGSYDLEISSTGFAYQDTVISGVAVEVGLESDIGTVELPPVE
jgi:hypothetical protein